MDAARVTIRAARSEDVDAVVALERGIAEAPHWAATEYAAMISRQEGAAVRRCLLVAERGGTLAGFAVGKAIGADEGAWAEIESVAVEPEARRSGVGRALCDAVIAWSRQERAIAVELEVRSANYGAIALYRGVGFEAVGVRRGYYREPADDAVLMRLEFPPQG